MENNDPCLQTVINLNAQTQFDIGVLAAAIAMIARESGLTREGTADLFDRAGKSDKLYASSTIKAVADKIRGRSLEPNLSLIAGGKIEH